MAAFPYSPNPGTIPKFLSHIQAAGVPGKVNREYLSTVGFKSSNDRYLIPIFKAVDFLDASGKPTARWREFRDKNKAGQVLAAGIRKGYAELFSIYPDAHRKDNEALRNFFASKSDWGTATLDRAVATFKNLCAAAKFEDVGSAQIDDPGPEPPASRSEVVLSPTPSPAAPPSINLNIQLELPATNEAEVYEKLFASMRKHLFGDAASSG